MGYAHLLFEPDEYGVALITVNRPQKLNALSREVIGELDDVFARMAGDSAIRAAIVTGAGEKAFVAGADINELAALSAPESRQLALRGQAVFRRLETCGKPSVAAVNGFALGGGLELAMACTVRFASENANDAVLPLSHCSPSKFSMQLMWSLPHEDTVRPDSG